MLVLIYSGAVSHAQQRSPADDERLELVEFRAVPLREALRLLSEQSGLNLAASIEAGTTEVTLFLRDVTARDALATLTRTHGLFFRDDPATGIITIYSNNELQESLQSFRDEETRVFTMLYPNAVDAVLAIQSLYGTRVIVGFGDSAIFTLQDLGQRFSRFDLIDGRSQGLGLFGGGGGFGGGGFGGGGGGGGLGGGGGGFGGGGFGGDLGGGGFGGGGFGGGGFGGGGFGGLGGGLGGIGGGFGGGGGGLLQGANRGQINQANAGLAGQAIAGAAPLQNADLQVDLSALTPEQIQAVVDAQRGMASERQLRELQRIQQASIFVTVIPRQNQVIVRTSDPETMEQIADLITKIDVPTPMVLLEVKIMEVTLADGFTSVFDYQFTDGNTSAGAFTRGDVLPPTGDLAAGNNRRFSSLTPGGAVFDPVDNILNAAAPLGNGNALFQIVDTNFRARVQMLESQNRVTTLASPLLMTANNEVSRLFVGNEVPLNRSFSGGATIGGVGGVAQGGANTTIEFRPVGTTLLITPSINADRTVTLRILQERSNIIPNGANVQIPDGTGGFTAQTIDTVNSRTYSGTVIAKDGMTLALGGLIDETVRDNRQSVPVLGKLPVVGILFRDQDTGRGRTELVMMIRPYIFNTPEEATCTSKWLVDEHSMHPNSPDAIGTLGTFSPHEVVRPNPPTTPLETIFRFHSVEPKDF
jgi:general secretion pathway protein D